MGLSQSKEYLVIAQAGNNGGLTNGITKQKFKQEVN